MSDTNPSTKHQKILLKTLVDTKLMYSLNMDANAQHEDSLDKNLHELLNKKTKQLGDLKDIIWHLQTENGCPWDREQDHMSLRPHLLEECYELLQAIDELKPSHFENIIEELGDVLLQVLMHGAIAERLGEFNFNDVTSNISEKLISRHPHVFSEPQKTTKDSVETNWEVLKKKERPEESTLASIPKTLPALARSQMLQRRATIAGFDWPDMDGPLEKLSEEIEELAEANSEQNKIEEFGDVLFTLVGIAQRLGIDTEQALRTSNDKFERRFTKVESLAQERKLELTKMELAELDAIWDEVKNSEHS